MDSKLRARFERLGPIRGIDRVSSGSPGAFVLRVPQLSGKVRSIDAMFSLARRGLTMLRAKRAVEMLLETGRVFVQLPTVESADAVLRELAAAGINAAEVSAGPPVDIRALRERLQLTWEQFALRFGLEVDTLRNWETGRREMDAAARSYLRAIWNDPEAVERAYAPTPEGQEAVLF